MNGLGQSLGTPKEQKVVSRDQKPALSNKTEGTKPPSVAGSTVLEGGTISTTVQAQQDNMGTGRRNVDVEEQKKMYESKMKRLALLKGAEQVVNIGLTTGLMGGLMSFDPILAGVSAIGLLAEPIVERFAEDLVMRD